LLSAVKLHTAVVTPIGVQGHVVPPNNGRLYRFPGPMPSQFVSASPVVGIESLE
jgi:hypothetical protein